MSVGWLHLVFGLGGGLGALARFALTVRLTHRYPISTLIVNVAGCFLLGLGLAMFAADQTPAIPEVQRLLVGFCGGFTTFSSFAFQSLDLHRSHSLRHAAANILANLALCLGAFVLGRGTATLL